jgi:ornithine cyclodeaminase/alanine dehydrogenase-like protein (mu-crystallin family)
MQSGGSVLHLDDPTIAELLDLGLVTEAVERAFAAWGHGEAHSAVRVRSSASGQMASAMAAVVPPFSGGKLYATVHGRFTFLNVLFDAGGHLVCTTDGDVITGFRTAAASAVVVRRLAPAEATAAAVLGAGRQGAAHVDMLAAELPALERLTIWSRDAENAAELVAYASRLGMPAVVAGAAPEAVAGADVIVTATASREPLFADSDVGDAVLVCAIGATKYDRCEIPTDLTARCAAIVCDDIAGSQHECGDLIHAEAAGVFEWKDAIELRDVVAGTVSLERPVDRPVLFESQGVALEDVAAAALAYQRYQHRKEAAS